MLASTALLIFALTDFELHAQTAQHFTCFAPCRDDTAHAELLTFAGS